MTQREFRVCQNSECGSFNSFPPSQNFCSECGSKISTLNKPDERGVAATFIMSHRASVAVAICLVVAAVALSFVSTGRLELSNVLGFLALHTFAQLIMLFRVYPLLASKGYEFNTDPKGHKFVACFLSPLALSLALIGVKLWVGAT